MTHALLAIAGEPEPADYTVNVPDVIRNSGHGLPAPLEELDWTANMLACSGIVPHLKGDVGRCMAVSYAAARLGMDAVGFASKTYFTPVKGGGERMAYEAQLVVAILYKLAPLAGRLDIEYAGQGAQRHCIVTGRVIGVRKPKRYVSPILGQIKPKNSPLWFTDPDQQLAYYSQRAWGRRYCPEALLGVYTPDELGVLDDVEEREKAIRADPFDESEFEAAEPSGGKDFAAAAKSMHGDRDDSQGGHPNAPNQQRGKAKPKDDPPKGDGVTEPEDLPELRAWAGTELARIVALTKSTDVDNAWIAMKADKRYRRLLSYDLALAKRIETTGEARFHELRDAEFPGDR